MKPIRSTIKFLVPRLILAAYGRERLRWDMARSRGKSKEEIFSDIYENNRWGGEPRRLLTQVAVRGPTSPGSIYRLFASSFIPSGLSTSSISGGGDFEVAQQILSPELTYTGCDIVPGLVACNAEQFGTKRIEFRTLDVVTDPLPEGDLCIIRQVFQHLSNGDIATVLRKAKQYPLLAVTDEQVVGDNSESNDDIIPYHGTRRLFGQGITMEALPFFGRVVILLEHSSGSKYSAISDTYLRTVLIRNDVNDRCAERRE